jgi:tRNA threonylcarbamoyladenosine biosynthesis protein TsaB
VLLLALDTSSAAVTVALFEYATASRVLAERTEVASNRHGELLAPLISDVLASAGAVPAQLGAIGVGLGPGPFTGLRVGIMTAKAMGDALGIPVYGECSLDVIAKAASGISYDHDEDLELDYVVMSDARRKQVYWARYGFTGVRVEGPEISAPVDLAESLRGRVIHLVGHGAAMYAEVFDGFTISDQTPYPSAARLAELVINKARAKQPSDDLTPLYLRRPDAQPPGRPKQVTPA